MGKIAVKKWYFWLVLAAVWIPSAVMNRADGRRSAAFITNLVQIGLFSLAALVQLVCEKKGEKGKRFFRFFTIGAVAFCVLYLLAALLLLRG